MEALVIIRAILLASAGVTAVRHGGIYSNVAPQDAALPNVVIMAVGGGEGLTHGGPDGLKHERVRIWARGRRAEAALALGVAIDKALNGYTGTIAGAHVQLVAKAMTMSDYDNDLDQHRSILDFRIHWSAAS